MKGITFLSKAETVRLMEASKDSEWVYVKDSAIHHKGLFAFKHIPKGTRIIEFAGEKIDKVESVRRLEEIDEKSDLMHIFELNEEYDVDGGEGGNDAIFINHCCDPNCEVDIIDDHIYFFALRDIQPDEEITFDYNCGFDIDTFKMGCRCGSRRCRNTIICEEEVDKLREILSKRILSLEDVNRLREIADDDLTLQDIKDMRRVLKLD
jgi:hypothetical protein